MKDKNTPPQNFEDKLILQLYVSGMSPKSMQAIENITKICEEFLNDFYELEIIDLYKYPAKASEYNIIFSPCLIKRSPLPMKILVGIFSDTDKVIKALGITLNN